MHFTYSTEPNNTTLCQGDVLQVTDDIRTVLNQHHPYFAKGQYQNFVIITQTCDLVRRKGGCNSPYITLAAVRTYDDFIERVSCKYDIHTVNGFRLLEESKAGAFQQLIERLYNNNEGEYFFLAQDAEVGIKENLVVYLKVSFALKSVEHYEKCLAAKTVELSDDFKAKLGWLVGQMYSRVGTKDWETIKKREEFLQMLRNDLNERFIISDKDRLRALEKIITSEKLSIDTTEDIEQRLTKIEIESKYDQAMRLIEDIIMKKPNMGSDEDKQALIRKIKSTSQLKPFFR